MEEQKNPRGRKPKAESVGESMVCAKEKKAWASPFAELLAEHFGRPTCVCGNKQTEWKLKRELEHEVTKYVMRNRHTCVCDNCAR